MKINRSIRISVLLSFSLGTALAQSATSKIVGAANSFLSTLDDKQKQSVLFAYDDEQQRKRWSNFPISIVPRAGLSMGELNTAQRAAAMALVSSALSPRGMEKVRQIMQGDEVLKTTEGSGRGPGGPPQGRDGGRGPGGPPQGRGGGRGGGLLFGSDLYYISLLGRPSEKSPWMLQFGGHHLAVNVTIIGERGILTPTLTGAQPALYTVDGKTVRPLGPESDKGLALLNSLDEGQKKQAILSFRLADLVLGPGQDGKTIQPEGLKASSLNEKQRAMLLDLVAEWAGIVNESSATARMAELKAEVNDMWFAWSGPVTAAPSGNIAAYYRIQSPHLVIEYAPQQMGGDASLHVHTMYRDPTNDYGRKPAAK
jgi:hypothetical protein